MRVMTDRRYAFVSDCSWEMGAGVGVDTGAGAGAGAGTGFFLPNRKPMRNHFLDVKYYRQGIAYCGICVKRFS